MFILSIFIFLVTMTIAGVYILFFTTPGSNWISKKVLSNYPMAEHFEIADMDGRLSENMVYHDIILTNPKGLPQGSILKIQTLSFHFTALDLKGLNATIENARLILPLAEPIVFQGTIKDGNLNLNSYTRSLDIDELAVLFPEFHELRHIFGVFNAVDLVWEGPWDAPSVNGQFFIEKLSREDNAVINAPGTVSLKFSDIHKGLELYGQVALAEGVFKSPRVSMMIAPSRVIFAGPLLTPQLDLSATTKVEKTKINMRVRGTPQEPDLLLSSEPSLTQEQILVVLVTGKSWKRTEALLESGHLSPDLAKDFVDYFVFSGSGSTMAKELGIREISFMFNEQSRGIGIRKGVSDRVDVDYAVEQVQETSAARSFNQKLGGEYQMTDKISVGLERELKQEQELGQQSPPTVPSQANDKVLLKYETQF